MSDDSGNDIFVTQNSFVEENFHESDIDSEFEKLLNESVSFVVKVTDESDNNSNNTTVDDLLSATQETEKGVSKSGRFGKPLSNSEFEALESMAKNKNTEKKVQWAVRIFNTWHCEQMGGGNAIESPLLGMTDTEINSHLCRFVTEVRNQKGDEYHGNSIHELLISVQRFLRENGRDINFTSDFTFTRLRAILDAKMKSLAQSGIGIHARRADVITPQQEDMLWEKGLLGEDTPQKLLDTLLYLNGINFCLRGGEEHRSLRVGKYSNFRITVKNNKKHLIYSEGVSKTNAGGLKHKNMTPKSVMVAENGDKPSRCLVRLYEKFMSLRPPDCENFYLRPLKYPKPGLWFSSAPVGRHVLESVVKRLCATAGFQGYYTNHSLRATTATRLYESGLDEQLIAERTGHRSTAIRGYKRTSEDMLQLVDTIVQRKTPRSETLNPPSTSCTSTAAATGSSAGIKDNPKPDRSGIHFVLERNGSTVTFQM